MLEIIGGISILAIIAFLVIIVVMQRKQLLILNDFHFRAIEQPKLSLDKTSMDSKCMKIRINFGRDNKLYQLGLFTLDFSELLMNLDLIEHGRYKDVHNFNGKHYEYPIIDRHEKHNDRVRIVNIGNGSIEFLLDNVSDFASIVVPFIVLYIGIKINNKNNCKNNYRRVVFEVETLYSKDVDFHIDRLEHFGEFDDYSLDTLIRALEVNDFDIKWDGDEKIVVRKTLDSYIKSTLRILKVNRDKNY